MIVDTSLSPPTGVGVASDVCVPLGAVTDESLVGGKAHALGRLIRAGLAVPEGFVLTNGALDGHLGGFGDMGTASTPRRRDAEEQLQAVLESALPTSVREALANHAATLLAQGPVVVRSSAIGEDGVAESFAGQLESILNVTDDVQLEQAVRSVWASLWSERAEFYRTARGVPMRGMGVVVQRQVDARVAGVMFTMTSSGEMLVEYGAGLADKLVAGEVDPGRVAIDRATGASRQLRISAECSARPSGRSQRAAARGSRGSKRSSAPRRTSSGRSTGMVRSTSSSRARSRRPCRFLSPPTANGRLISWSNANVNENFPRPISPLLYSIASAGYTHYFRNLAVAFGVSPARVRAMEPAFQQIIGVHGARMYYNLTSIHSVLRLAPFGDALTKSFDTFVGADGGDGRDDRGRSTRQSSSDGRDRGHRRSRDCLLLRIGRRIERFERTVDEFAARAEPARLGRLSLLELRGLLAGFMEIRCHQWLDASLGRRGVDDLLRRARATAARRTREWTPPCTRRFSKPFRTS